MASRTEHPDEYLAAVRAGADPIRVLVADDHPLFRRGVARAVQRRAGLELAAEAADGVEALSLIDALRPDVAVVDVRMPGLSGLEVCEALHARARPCRTAVVILSAFDDDALVTAAERSGAAVYLGKDASQDDVCAAIEAAARQTKSL